MKEKIFFITKKFDFHTFVLCQKMEKIPPNMLIYQMIRMHNELNTAKHKFIKKVMDFISY